MTLAILCSGQGLQHAGMFALTENDRRAESLFAHAATLLDGRDPREIVHTDPIEMLQRNRAGQILCSLQALAATVALDGEMPARRVVAGYSVGELAAWGVAGAIGMTDVLDLVASRASAMDKADPAGGGLLFIRGLSRTRIDALCLQYGVDVAIVNPGDAFVLGGSRPELHAAAAEANAMHAIRVVNIPVHVASHTKRLLSASTEFRERLRAVALQVPFAPGVRLLSGIDGAPVLDTTTGLDKLAAQISQTVHWSDCLQACVESGVTAFLELGPGAALSEMTRGVFRSTSTRCLDDFRTLEGVRAWLRSNTAEDPAQRS